MILIGENLNVISQSLGPALRERNAEPIEEMAKAETEADIDLIDLNIGPARKGGDELMTWVVNTVQAVTAKMLSLDTTNLDAMEAGLKARRGPVLINSVSLQTSRVDRGLAMAAKYNADVIGLLWSNEGMPRDVNERAMHAVDFCLKANAAGVPNEKIWIDPIASPISVEINQVKACVEFMGMLAEIAPGCKSTVGLSRTYMIMLMRYGLYSAIVDAFDKDLKAIARGQRPDIVALVHRVMDGDTPDPASLTQEMANYAKTARVLKGERLYSHSWLEE
jgi:5-methyltetrahydrofolate corrinoid/iron sulfur protein methyltransferase